jgi:pseudaminic acid cytidylyltransferase
MNIAVIPARGGSKRIPWKNIKLFAGSPMMSYSIKAAFDSKMFDRVIVSTDSEKIAAVARDFGAEIPFLRSKELSDDFTGTDAVVLDTLERLSQTDNREHIDYVCCIYATAPFLLPEDLQRGFEVLKQSGAGSAFTVTSFPYPIFRSLRENEAGCLEMIWPEHKNARSQDLPQALHDAGQFYLAKADYFKSEKTFWTKDARPIHQPRQRVQDIDTPEDWEIAEQMFAKQIS